jgi:hypothetical protein
VGRISTPDDSSKEEMKSMATKDARTRSVEKDPGRPYRVRLPGFIADEEVGLGDAVKRATSLMAIRPCGGCDKRAEALNQWLTFSGRRFR